MAKPLFSRQLGSKQEKGVSVSVSSSKTYLRKFSPFFTLKTIPSSNAMGRNAAFNNGLLGDPYPNHSTCFTDTKKPENINERDRKQKLGKTTSLRGRKMFLSRMGWWLCTQRLCSCQWVSILNHCMMKHHVNSTSIKVKKIKSKKLCLILEEANAWRDKRTTDHGFLEVVLLGTVELTRPSQGLEKYARRFFQPWGVAWYR